MKVVGLGAGGHCRVLLEILLGDGSLEIVGLLDRNGKQLAPRVMGIPVMGDDSLLCGLRASGIEGFFIGLGSTENTEPRRTLYERALFHGLTPVSAIHPRSIVSPHAVIGRGASVMAAAVINPMARIGDNVIVNTGAVVEHDCIIGNHVHVATGARLAGGIRIGDGAHIGIGATVIQGVAVGAGAVLGAGAVAVGDIPPGVVATGCPARSTAPAR